MGTMTKADTFKLLDRFYEMGGNFIDLANNYQEGEAETWTGEWVSEIDLFTRQSLIRYCRWLGRRIETRFVRSFPLFDDI